MKSYPDLRFTLLYLFIVVCDILFSHSNTLFYLHYFTKPLIVGSLLVFFLNKSKGIDKRTVKFTLMALIFSIIGDSFLMISRSSEHFFTIGLLSFLLAHVMYIAVFNQRRNKNVNPSLFIVFSLIYGIGLFWLIREDLGNLLIPVAIYMLVILSMSSLAFWRRGSVSTHSYTLVLSGALCFIVSDSLLAINKFYASIPYPTLSVMTTYALAQILIIKGILVENSSCEKSWDIFTRSDHQPHSILILNWRKFSFHLSKFKSQGLTPS